MSAANARPDSRSGSPFCSATALPRRVTSDLRTSVHPSHCSRIDACEKCHCGKPIPFCQPGFSFFVRLVFYCFFTPQDVDRSERFLSEQQCSTICPSERAHMFLFFATTSRDRREWFYRSNDDPTILSARPSMVFVSMESCRRTPEVTGLADQRS